MFKITNFQLYCILLLLVAPIAFLETPKRISTHLFNNAWLAAFAGIIPGLLLVLVFSYIIKRSNQPFPILLEEHLGKICGRVMGFCYILEFILLSGYSLRHFVDFIITNVLPNTPISIFTGILLLVGFIAIKSGLENIARLCEMLTLIGLPFALLILILALSQHHEIENLLPFAYMDYKSFGAGLLFAFTPLTKIMPVLSLAFFCPQKQKSSGVMIKALFTSVAVIGLTTLAITMAWGETAVNLLTFPTFALVRAIQIGEFVQNIDIIFIGIWILGIFAATTIPWFMACFTIQKIFKLHDYRFLAAPTALIIGITSIIISRNILEEELIGNAILPITYILFFVIIPLILFVVTLFKPDIQSYNAGSELSSSE